MLISSGKGSSGGEAEKLVCLTKLNKYLTRQTVSLLGEGLVFMCVEKYSATDLKHEQRQEQGGSKIQAGLLSIETDLLKSTMKEEGVRDLERVTLDTHPLDTCQQKEKTSKSYTKQNSFHPNGWCTGKLHLDASLTGCNTAPWLGVGVGGLQCMKEVNDDTLAKDFGFSISAGKEREGLLSTISYNIESDLE